MTVPAYNTPQTAAHTEHSLCCDAWLRLLTEKNSSTEAFQTLWQTQSAQTQALAAAPCPVVLDPQSQKQLQQLRQLFMTHGEHPALLNALALYRRGPQDLPHLTGPQDWQNWYRQWHHNTAFLRYLPTQENNCITVILPTYNRLERLQEAVACIQNQSSSDWQLMIGDDASSDGTEKWCQALIEQDTRIHYLRHKNNRGMAGNCEALYDAVETEWVTTLADDDALLPRSLEVSQALIQQFPHVAAVGGGYYQLDLIREQLHAKQNGPYYAQPCVADTATELQRCGLINPVFGGGLVLRKSVLTALSPCDPTLEKLRYSSWDYWLSSALLSRYEMAYSPEILSIFANRQAEDTQTAGRDWAQGLLEMMAQFLERYEALFGPQTYPQAVLSYYFSVLVDSHVMQNFKRLLKQTPREEYAAVLAQQSQQWQRYHELYAQYLKQSADAGPCLIQEHNVSGLSQGVIPGIQQGHIPPLLQHMIQRQLQVQ